MRRKNRNHYETMFSLFQFTSGTSLIQSVQSRNVSVMYCSAMILAILVRIRNGSVLVRLAELQILTAETFMMMNWNHFMKPFD